MIFSRNSFCSQLATYMKEKTLRFFMKTLHIYKTVRHCRTSYYLDCAALIAEKSVVDHDFMAFIFFPHLYSFYS